MMQNHVIRSDDPQAVEKLQVARQADRNARPHEGDQRLFPQSTPRRWAAPASDEDAAKLDRRVQEGYSWEKQPYPSYVLSGNTAEMRRLRHARGGILDAKHRICGAGLSGWPCRSRQGG